MNENLIVELEKEKIVTSTFRKLSPDKKLLIYQSSMEAFSSQAFDRVSLDTIARDAGISKGSLFQYFETKENLFRFVSRIFIDQYSEYWKEYFRSEQSVRAIERIRDYLHENIIQWQGREKEFNFLSRQMNENPYELTHKFISQLNEIHQTAVHRIIERGTQTGELRGDISSGHISLVIIGILEKIVSVYSHRFNGKLNESRLVSDIEKYIRIIFEGITA